MRRSWLWAWLGVRALAISPRDTLLRAAVFCAAVLIMLVGCSLQPTALERSARIADNVLPLRAQPTAESGLLVAQASDYFEGTAIDVRRVAAVGGATAPPGVLDVVPAPGQLVASPEMARVLAGSAVLRDRYPGTVVGTVPDDQLLGPRSLVVWVGVEADLLPPEAGWLAPGGSKSADDIASVVPGEITFAVPMLVLGFMIPMLALLGLLSTLNGERRDRRLAALRLLGLSESETKRATAVEAATVAVVATLAGVAVYLGARGFVAGHLPVEGGVWPQDVRIPVWQLAAVLVGFPALAALTSWWSARAVSASPLGVERGTRAGRVRRWPLVLLAVGLVGLVVVLAEPPGLRGSEETRAQVTMLVTATLMVGLPLGVPAVLAALVRRRSPRTPHLGELLALRRLSGDPGRATRIAAGLTLVVLAAGPLLVFFPLISDAGAPSLTRLGALIGDRTLVTTQGPLDPATTAAELTRRERDAERRDGEWARVERAGASDGVRVSLGLVTATVAEVATGGVVDGDGVRTALVADCADLEAVTGIAASSCARGLVLPGTEAPRGAGSLRTLVEEAVDPEAGTVSQVGVGRPFDAGSDPVVSDDLATLVDGLSSPATLLLPADAVGNERLLRAAGRTQLTVPSGAAGTADEEARTRVISATGLPSLTVGEREQIARRTTRQFEIVSVVAGLLIVLIAGLATTISAVEAVNQTAHERRLLTITGAPGGLLTRTLLVRVAAPVVLAVTPATALSVVLCLAYVSLVDFDDIAVPAPAIGLTGALAVLVPGLVVLVVARVRGREDLTALTE